MDQIPQWMLRLAGLGSLPAIPLDISETLESLPKLLKRLIEQVPAKDGLSNNYTIGGHTATGQEFLFGGGLDDRLKGRLEDLASQLNHRPSKVVRGLYKDLAFRGGAAPDDAPSSDLTGLALDSPEQWSISWTNFQNVYAAAQPQLERWASTLTEVQAAEEEFWPTMAQYGVAYNLLILQKLKRGKLRSIKQKLGNAWTSDLAAMVDAGVLFAIDMSIFESANTTKVDGFERFTPATITLLKQDPATKRLTPILIRVAGKNGANAQVFTAAQSASAWLYAMLAAKTSVTVWGIWLGHVYQYHIITAAMQMTMFEELPKGHPVRDLLEPQSNYLIGFDDVLLLLWRHIAPPTSICSPGQFLELLNAFADGRPFERDDPRKALQDLGIEAADFTVDTPWDAYPIVGYFLEVWDACEAFVNDVVSVFYHNDQAVEDDKQLQEWISESEDWLDGNIQGLPDVDTRAELSDILTSLIYRITMHGISRPMNTANPAMTFVPNFPPCLQNADIPAPTANIETKTLMEYLPRTGTIGVMMTFYFTFAFSEPYEPLIPADGNTGNLYFADGDPQDPRNQALIRFREAMTAFMKKYEGDTLQLHQWPLNIET